MLSGVNFTLDPGSGRLEQRRQRMEKPRISAHGKIGIREYNRETKNQGEWGAGVA